MIKYEELLNKRLAQLEKDALSTKGSFMSAYASGRIHGMLEGAFHSGNKALFDKVEIVYDRINKALDEE